MAVSERSTSAFARPRDAPPRRCRGRLLRRGAKDDVPAGESLPRVAYLQEVPSSEDGKCCRRLRVGCAPTSSKLDTQV